MVQAPRRARWLLAMTALSLAGCQLAPVTPLSRSQAASLALAPDAPVQSAPQSHPSYHITALGSTQYIVSMRDDAIPTGFAAMVATHGGVVDETLDAMGVAFVDSARPDFASSLASEPLVSGVAPVAPVGGFGGAGASGGPGYFDPSVTEDDPSGPSGEPLSGYQWGLETTHVPEAWDLDVTGRGVKVAVLDTGVDEQNPDLAPNLMTRLSTSFVDSEPTFSDFNGHGSHVAGLIAAADNDYGVTGVAPEASIIAVKVLDRRNKGNTASVLKGLMYAADTGARVINMSIVSWTKDASTMKAFEKAARYARRRGAIIVAAAGNEGKNPADAGYTILPAMAQGVVSVGAVGPKNQQGFDDYALYSNFGSFLKIAAPGGGLGFSPTGRPILYTKRDLICSTWSTQGDRFVEQGFAFHPASHMFLIGTSQAAPHVTGTLALMLSANPELSPRRAIHMLLRTADHVGSASDVLHYGAGRLNAARAVREAQGDSDERWEEGARSREDSTSRVDD